MNKAFLFLLVLLSACSNGSESGNKRSEQKKSHTALKSTDPMNVIVDGVYAAIIDSCYGKKDLIVQDYFRITPKMHQLIYFGGLKKICPVLEEQLGVVEEKKLIESFYSGDKVLKIFRYKITCSKIEKPVEFRLVFTHENKLTEFRFFEWKNEYKKDLIKMNWF